jgi:PTH1 family peptidyl-tRNA hydrolase
MKLIVGLGNPGTQYAKTRHNAGFMVIDALCAKHAMSETPKSRFSGLCVEANVGSERCLLLKPTTFMNRSGQSVSEAVRFFKVDPKQDLLVIVDELYLPTGTVRLKPGGGTGGHNGLASIEQLLGVSEYPRLRVGVGLQAEGEKPGGGKPAFIDQADFVLGRFSPEEEPLFAASLKKAVEATEAFASRGLTMAMNLVNAGPSKPKPAAPKAQPTETSTANTPKDSTQSQKS